MINQTLAVRRGLMAKNENVEIIGVGDLKPDPQNARKHTPRNVAMVGGCFAGSRGGWSIVSMRRASFLPETPR